MILFLLAAIGVVAGFLLNRRADALMKKAKSGELTLKEAAAVPVLQFFGTASSIAAATYATLGMVFLALSLFSRSSAAAAFRILEGLEIFQKKLEPWKSGWEYAFVVFLLLASGIAIYRRGVKRRREQMQTQFHSELERLRTEHAAGKWETLAPNEAMQQLAEKVVAASGILNSPDARLTEAERSALNEFIAKGTERYEWMDLVRRMKPPTLDGADDAENSGRGFAGRLRRGIFNKGVLEIFEGGGGLASKVSIALAIAGTVAVSGGQGVATVIELSKNAIESAHVLSHHEEAKGYLAELDKQDTQNTQLTAQQQQAINRLSRGYEQNFARSDLWNLKPEDRARNRVVRRQIVGEDILRQGAANHTTPDATPESAVHNGSFSPQEQANFSAFDDTLTHDEPTTSFGKSFRERLTKLAKADESIRRQLDKLAQSFHEELEAPELFKASLSHAASMVMGKVKVGEGPWQEVVSEGLSDVGAEEMEVVDDTLQATYWKTAKATGDLKSAGEALKKVRPRDIATASQQQAAAKWAASFTQDSELAANLAVHPARAHSKEDAAQAASKVDEAWKGVVEEALDLDQDAGTATASERAEQAASLMDPLRGIDDYFPAQVGDEARTRAGRLQSAFEPSTGIPAEIRGSEAMASHVAPEVFGSPSSGGVAEAAAQGVVQGALSAFERSGSYALLEGFSRIGGVLIGRDKPEVAKPLPAVRDVSWTKSGNVTRLTLKRQNGAPVELEFRSSILQQALLYAADGRPIATTMTSAMPLPDLKVQAHPTLADTPIGCRAVEIDRLVDTFMPGKAREAAGKLVKAQDDLYRYAYLVRRKAAIGAMEEKLLSAVMPHTSNDALSPFADRPADSGPAQELLSRVGGLERIQRAISTLQAAEERDGALIARLEESFKNSYELAGDVKDANSSLLAAKPDYFDETIVSILAECGRPGVDAESYRRCVQTAGEKQVAAAPYEQLHSPSWLAEPAKFEIWSGVRERNFTLDSNLRFLRPPQNDALWPFDFILQVAFVSEPRYRQQTSDHTDVDVDPWTFPSLHDAIKVYVENGLKGDAAASAYVADMREFTIAQRFVRAALNGQLGDAFPIEKLIALTKDTAYTIPGGAATPRWTPHPDIAFLQLEAAIAKAPQVSTANGISACRAKIDSLTKTGGDALRRMIELERSWGKGCDVGAALEKAQQDCKEAQSNDSGESGACRVAQRLGEIDIQSKLIGLRPALGLTGEEEKLLGAKPMSVGACVAIP